MVSEHGWNHPMCLPCWRKEHLDRDPVRVIGGETETCCNEVLEPFSGIWAPCGRPTTHGIYVRGEPHR